MKIVITVKDTNNVIGLKEDIAMRLEGVADIIRIDTADVVPKSEVEMLQGALKAEERHNELTMEMAKKALANAKAEVAMDVFAEIERVIGEKYELYVFDDREIEGVKQDAIIEFADCMQKHFDKLKKKYTEKQT